MDATGNLAFIGRRIKYTGDSANRGGNGAIVKLSARGVDIILEDGREIRSFPYSALAHISQKRGCYFRVLCMDDVADVLDISQLITAAAIRKATESAKKEVRA